eukprot:3853228-Pleurochrysis_carterae.AAC.1
MDTAKSQVNPLYRKAETQSKRVGCEVEGSHGCGISAIIAIAITTTTPTISTVFLTGSESEQATLGRTPH